jgi:hypothetical protein
LQNNTLFNRTVHATEKRKKFIHKAKSKMLKHCLLQLTVFLESLTASGHSGILQRTTTTAVVF